MVNQKLTVRISQLLLIIPCALREWINVITDIGQYHKNIHLALQIISFPTKAQTDTVFNRSIHSLFVAKIIAISWTLAHFIAAILISSGFLLLLCALNTESVVYQNKKQLCLLGLSFTLFWYIFALGFGSMDYFLSWMQKINYNGDIMGYGLPLGIALLYLLYKA